MTEETKQAITNMREAGKGYATISKELGISVNTVKSFCRRAKVVEHICPSCGKVVKQTPGRKEKKFCDYSCRMKWWKEHPDGLNRKANYSQNCACCGSKFIAYGNNHRKYCSHSCYITNRFRGGAANE